MGIINQHKIYGRMPSEIMRIDDEYTAYCFDEAIAYLIIALEEDKKIRWCEGDSGKVHKNNDNFISFITGNR